MSLLWFFMGATVVGIIWALTSWIRKNEITLNWQIWTGMISGIILGLFCVAWAISSIIEGENQSAGMGILIFGSVSLIILSLTRRSYVKNIQKV